MYTVYMTTVWKYLWYLGLPDEAFHFAICLCSQFMLVFALEVRVLGDVPAIYQRDLICSLFVSPQPT